jgi:A/G-specific adenine glycosylase
LDHSAIRKSLARWFAHEQRDLPWRRTRDPYAIWISEIMLQQTRVAAVIPYYERFLARFPDYHALAAAPEDDVLAMWAGLGYYSRARNLQKAARQMVELGGFPREHAAIRELAGIGDYTAGAVASIAFGLPHPAIDGNVRRVVVRLAGDADAVIEHEAGALLDVRNPGRHNQALMELGAMICVPRDPRCAECPVESLCGARRAGLETSLPPAKMKAKLVRRERTLVVVRRDGKVLLVPSPRVSGFWDLPEPFPGIHVGAKLGTFRHAITTSQYVFEVHEASLTGRMPKGARWWDEALLHQIPFGTASKKALRCLEKV